MAEANQGHDGPPVFKTERTLPPETRKPEILDRIGDLEINGYPDTIAEQHAINIRNKVLEGFERYSGYDRAELEFLMKDKKWILNPISPYLNAEESRLTMGDIEPVAASAWDVNGCLMEGRDGYDSERTFHPELYEAIKMQIDRLGSFIMVSALTGDQMAWLIAKEHKRAVKTGEKSIAENTIMSAENGKTWLIPRTENGKIIITEYQLPLSEEKHNALANLKGKVSEVGQVLNDEGMVAFVNGQKFSKCTMEASKNGREWYEQTIRKVLLPFLAKNGAVWDGNPERFILDDVEFAVSATGETWEIEITEGSDKIGKGFATEILQNTISDILHERSPKNTRGFKMITGGDSPTGSDRGLTDPNRPTIPFVIQNRERQAGQTMDVINDAIRLKRKYWPEYIEDEKGARLAGPGVAPAGFMKAVAETVPHLKIPTEEFAKALVTRLTRTHGFRQVKEYTLGDDQLQLYDFPENLSLQQQETFLKAKSDLPVPASDETQVNALIDKIRIKMGLNQ